MLPNLRGVNPTWGFSNAWPEMTTRTTASCWKEDRVRRRWTLNVESAGNVGSSSKWTTYSFPFHTLVFTMMVFLCIRVQVHFPPLPMDQPFSLRFEGRMVFTSLLQETQQWLGQFRMSPSWRNDYVALHESLYRRVFMTEVEWNSLFSLSGSSIWALQPLSQVRQSLHRAKRVPQVICKPFLGVGKG